MKGGLLPYERQSFRNQDHLITIIPGSRRIDINNSVENHVENFLIINRKKRRLRRHEDINRVFIGV